MTRPLSTAIRPVPLPRLRGSFFTKRINGRTSCLLPPLCVIPRAFEITHLTHAPQFALFTLGLLFSKAENLPAEGRPDKRHHRGVLAIVLTWLIVVGLECGTAFTHQGHDDYANLRHYTGVAHLVFAAFITVGWVATSIFRNRTNVLHRWQSTTTRCVLDRCTRTPHSSSNNKHPDMLGTRSWVVTTKEECALFLRHYAHDYNKRPLTSLINSIARLKMSAAQCSTLIGIMPKVVVYQ